MDREGRHMRWIQLSLVIAAAAVLAVWRGVALYKHAFYKKDL
jgi:hypothetical protein